jgi:hypothetical protein
VNNTLISKPQPVEKPEEKANNTLISKPQPVLSKTIEERHLISHEIAKNQSTKMPARSLIKKNNSQDDGMISALAKRQIEEKL